MSTRAKYESWARMHWRWDFQKERTVARLAREVPDDAKAVELIDRRRPDVRVIISLDTYPGELNERRPWRASRFDHIGPSGHHNGATLRDVLYSLHGIMTQSTGIPYASASTYRISRVIRSTQQPMKQPHQ